MKPLLKDAVSAADAK